MWFPVLGLHALHKLSVFLKVRNPLHLKLAPRIPFQKLEKGNSSFPSEEPIGIIFMIALTVAVLQEAIPILSCFPSTVGNFPTAAAALPFIGQGQNTHHPNKMVPKTRESYNVYSVQCSRRLQTMFHLSFQGGD